MSFTSETRERTRPVLPLAAMVDVLFLLLIFFMTASVFRQQELQIAVDLPTIESDAAQAGSGNANQIPITFNKDGEIHLGSTPVALSELKGQLEKLAEDMPDDAVVIRGDRGSRYELALALLDIARDAGFTRVSLAGVRPAEPEQPSQAQAQP